MLKEEFKNLFDSISPDASLVERTEKEIENMLNPGMKRNIRRTVCLAIAAILLLTGAGIAATRLGIFDFFAAGITPLPGAEDLVETNLGNVENELATLTVEEALFDGRGALVKLRLAPKNENQVLFNAFMQGASEEYLFTSAPVEVDPSIIQTRKEGGVETKLINNADGPKITVDGAEVPIPESEQEALDKGLPAYWKDGKLWYSEQRDFKFLGRKDGKELVDYWPDIQDAGQQNSGQQGYSISYDAKPQEDGSVLLWASLWAENPIDQDREYMMLKIAVQTFRPDGDEVPMEALEIRLPKILEERHVKIVPLGDGKIAELQLHAGEGTFTRVRGYIHMDYSYPAEDERYENITLHYYSADGTPIPTGGGGSNYGHGSGSWADEIQSFETLPESLWVEARGIGGEILGRIECSLIEE